MSMRSSRRGFFFIIDTLLAIIVIVGGIMLILSTHTQSPLTAQAAYTVQDLLKQLGSTYINESSDPVIINARFNGTFGTSDNYRSILEEIVYLYNISNYGTAAQIVNSSAASLVPINYNVEFLVNQTFLYGRNASTVTKAQAPFVLTDKRIVMGITNTSSLFGPYIVEFRIWQ